MKPSECPHCRRPLYWHSKTVWCMRCGWARNLTPPDLLPATSETPEEKDTDE